MNFFRCTVKAEENNRTALLLDDAINYANRHQMMISLETHNEKNLEFYHHFGFQLYDIVEAHFSLKQYCMIKEPAL